MSQRGKEDPQRVPPRALLRQSIPNPAEARLSTLSDVDETAEEEDAGLKAPARVQTFNSNISDEHSPYAMLAIPKENADLAPKPLALNRSSTIVWNVPFDEDPNNHNAGSTARIRRPSAYPGMRGKMSNMARRPSAAVAAAVTQLDPLKPKGNPLDIKINEVRRVSSAGFNASSTFNARRPSHIPGRLTQNDRKQSVFQRPGMGEKEDEYIIQRLPGLDDVENMTTFKRVIYRLSPVLTVLALAGYGCYFALRVIYTLDAENAARQIFWMSWMFAAAELLLVVPVLLQRLWGWHAVGNRQRPKLRLLGNHVPSVDVIIPCSGEPDDLVMDCAKAACNIDFPPESFRVVICDDGRSKKLREAAERIGETTFDNLYCRSRPADDVRTDNFRTANLNFALEVTKTLPGGAANFIAIVNPEMIVMRDWLRALLPHMLQDPECSMACPPQLFYNIPRDDPLSQVPDSFIHISESMKDSLGIASCTGSGFILRRKTLVDMGGFRSGTVSEDVCGSNMLLGSGWNTAFIHEPLQWGAMPDSLASHLRQRSRWTIAAIHTTMKMRLGLFGKLAKHMTLSQRLRLFVFSFGSIFTVFLVLASCAVPVALATGGPMVAFRTIAELRWLIRANFGAIILNRLSEYVYYIPAGYRTGQRDVRTMMWMAPFNTLAMIRAFLLPRWLGGNVASFASVRPSRPDINERDAKTRAPAWRRFGNALFRCLCIYHFLFIIAALGTAGLATYWNVTRPANQTTRDILIGVLTHAGWPPVVWLALTTAYWTPINYALFPPTVPDREDLLARDPETGVAYPTEGAKMVKFSGWTSIDDFQYAMLTVYTAFVFGLTFVWL